MIKKPIIFFLGKSGSGKDTQAEILIQKFGFDFISTGQLLRDFKNRSKDFPKDSIERYEADRVAHILDEGKFTPTLTVACQWRFAALEVLKNFAKTSGLVFVGSPRKLGEAMILDDFFEYWPEAQEHFSVKPIELSISDEEAKKRLFTRGREDDKENAIQNRLNEFQEFVLPVINYFKESGRLLTVNGEQSVDDVQKSVLKVLELDIS